MLCSKEIAHIEMKEQYFFGSNINTVTRLKKLISYRFIGKYKIKYIHYKFILFNSIQSWITQWLNKFIVSLFTNKKSWHLWEDFISLFTKRVAYLLKTMHQVNFLLFVKIILINQYLLQVLMIVLLWMVRVVDHDRPRTSWMLLFPVNDWSKSFSHTHSHG